MTWAKSTEVYTFADYHGPLVLFAGDQTSGALHRAPRQWHVMDLKPLGVAPDATFAMLSANLIITDLTNDIENLTVCARPVGSTFAAGNYQLQAVSVAYGNGVRGRQGPLQVKLTNGCFELYWDATSAGVPDTSGSTFLINMSLDMWGRCEVPAPAPEPQPAPTVITVPAGGVTISFVPEAQP